MFAVFYPLNIVVSALRRWIPSEIRIPIYVMIIASVVSTVQMLINAYTFNMYQSLAGKYLIDKKISKVNRGRSTVVSDKISERLL